MPRARPKTRHARAWWGNPFSLSKNAREALIEIAGLDSTIVREADQAQRMIKHVEQILGQYPGMVQALDRAPESSHVLAELIPLKQHADAMIAMFDELSVAARGHFRDIQFPKLRVALDRVANRVEMACRAYKGKETRHAPVKHALRYVTYRLALVFWTYKPPGDELTDAHGHPVSPYPDAYDFVKTALKAAHINPPGHNLLHERCLQALEAFMGGLPAY